MVDVFKLAAEFAEGVIGLPRPASPTRLNPDRKRWAIGALREEVTEFEDAGDPDALHNIPEVDERLALEDEIDALVDTIYFAAGRLHEMGVDGGAHFLEVHRANMGKVRGELSKRPGAQGFDAVKPEGWVGPDHGRILDPPLKILLIGHARHGKDTVAELLRDRHGLRFQSSSMFAAERVVMPYFASQGAPYASVEECYADRVNHRATWYRLILGYNTPHRHRLASELLKDYDVYCGMRSAEELIASRGLFDAVVWVDASGRDVPPEADDSCTVLPVMASYRLDNSGTLQELEAGVDALVARIKKDLGR